jgi:hypothetical protein
MNIKFKMDINMKMYVKIKMNIKRKMNVKVKMKIKRKCCMSILLVLLHASDSYPYLMTVLHVHVAMLHVHAAPAAYKSCISLLHVLAVCQFSKPVLHVRAA